MITNKLAKCQRALKAEERKVIAKIMTMAVPFLRDSGYVYGCNEGLLPDGTRRMLKIARLRKPIKGAGEAEDYLFDYVTEAGGVMLGMESFSIKHLPTSFVIRLANNIETHGFKENKL